MTTWHGFRCKPVDPDHTVAMAFWQSRHGIDPRQLINVREFASRLTRPGP